MALRDKLRDRVQPHLEPGEQIQTVFMCQTGPSPYFAFLSGLIVLFGAKYYIVAATDRNLVVLRGSAWVPSKPKGFDRRLPRAIQIGPLSGMWGKSEFLGTKAHIHKRFHKDVETADAMLGGAAAGGGAAPGIGAPGTGTPGVTPAGWYPDPERPGGQRYFDGSTWTEQRS